MMNMPLSHLPALLPHRLPSTGPSPAPGVQGRPGPPQPSTGAASPDGVVYDPMEDPTNLKPLFEKGASPSFPTATTSEQTCWQTISVSGNARKDYESITAKCGASTGSIEYVRPTIGN